MSFFRRSSRNTSRVAPLPPEPKPKTQHNNYFTSDTFYLCSPGKADFFVDKLLVEQALQMAIEHKHIADNERSIDTLTTKIYNKQQDLLNTHGNILAQQQLNMQLEYLTKTLKTLEIEKAYLGEKNHAYIPVEDYYSTAAEAITACLAKNAGHDLILIEISTPVEKLNMALVGNKEVTRPNLLSCIESVKSISQEDAKKIQTTNVANPKDPKSQSTKINPVTLQVINEVLADATEYKKSIIMKSDPALAERTRHSTSDRKRSSTSSGRLSILPTIEEKEYFKVIKIDPQISIAFEEIKPGKNPYQSPEPSPRNRGPGNRG